MAQAQLMLLDDHNLELMVARKPTLRSYLFVIESARRYQPHILSLKEEELLSATAPNNDWTSELYDQLRAQLPVTPLQR